MTIYQILKIVLIMYGCGFLFVLLFVGYHFSVHLNNTRKPGLKTVCRCEYEKLLKDIKYATNQHLLILPSHIRIFVNKFALSVSCKSMLYMQGELNAALLNRSHELQNDHINSWGIDLNDLPTRAGVYQNKVK